MISTKSLLLAFIAGSSPLAALAAGPANDNFAGAAALTLDANNSASTTGDNTTATAQASEPDHFTYGGSAGATHSLWWKFVAPYSGTVQVDTKSSAINTALAIYTGATVNHLFRVAQDAGSGNTSSTGPKTSVITLPVVKGITYQIAVDGFASTDTGALSLKLQYLRINTARTYQTALIGGQVKEDNGLLTITTSTSSLVTGRFTLGAHAYPFTGAVATDGRLLVSINRPGQSPVLMDLTIGQVLDGVAVGPVVGDVEVDDVTTTIKAYPVALYTAAHPCPRYQYGRHYNVAVDTTGAVGYGISTVTVSNLGTCTGSGILADGTSFTYAAPLLDDSGDPTGDIGNGGSYCYHVPLYSTLGQITGHASFDASSAPTTLNGELQWFRPATGATFLPAGIDGIEVFTFGNMYTPPDATHRVDPAFDSSNGASTLNISNVDFAALSQNLTLTNANLLPVATAPNYIALKIATATGVLSGTTKLLPASVNGPSKVANVYGIVIGTSSPHQFYGFATGTTGTSTVLLAPNP